MIQVLVEICTMCSLQARAQSKVGQLYMTLKNQHGEPLAHKKLSAFMLGLIHESIN